MSSHGEATLPATRRARKSIGGSSRKSSDKENATVDLGGTMEGASRKKLRSKSMGPGSLDILKSGTGNRRASLAVPSRPPPRSILKPTMPILPDIPPHKPKKSSPSSTTDAAGVSGDTSQGSGAGTKVALRTEEEQQAAAREREERERAQMEKEINDRREARRKSLANRRVSFAAEATLHTFHEVEYMPDSTTSTDSTRRASSVAAPSPAPRPEEHHGSDASEPPSTPPEHIDEPEPESPANQRDQHQRKNRRSSGAASLYDDGDDTIASTVYDSDLEHADGVTEIHGEEMTDSSDSDEEDGTMMTVEAEEMTSASIASRYTYSGDSTTGDLDENLRLAAQRAVTQRVDDEEEEVIAGFAGWGRKNSSNFSSENVTQEVKQPAAPAADHNDEASDVEMTMEMDMDITNAVGGILRPKETPLDGQDDEGEEMDMEMSMDVTKALGGIIPKAKPQTRRKSIKHLSHQVEDTTSFGEQTMEFTTAVGGIQGRVSDASHFTNDSNEDMSMELTTAVGNVLAGALAPTVRRRTVLPEGDDASVMDMTAAVGRILPTDTVTDQDGDETMGMDMTMAVGGILKPSAPETRTAGRKVMELEADAPEPSVTASIELPQSPKRRASVNENGSPELAAFQGKGLRRSPARSASPPKAKSPTGFSSSPVKEVSPSRNAAVKSQTPSRAKTPPAMIGSRSSSPVKVTPRSPSKSKKLFHQDPSTGASTPRVVLTPQGRRLSGVGADRAGLGSPKVAQMFDRRGSIGDATITFVPGQASSPRRTVAFADPRAMEAEIDKERQVEEEKENSRRILEREADGAQDTLTLREMIQGLSPKKNPLRGRKSLHVGSARGILGKRPAELADLDDDEQEDSDGVKRLKGHQGSPVKSVKLPSPPSKAETTTGRQTRSGLRNAGKTAADSATPTTVSSPPKATTPKSHGRFKYVDDQPTNTMDFDHTAQADLDLQQGDDDGERIHLQDFLNMTSIRFMELTTTKRRHTVVPSAPRGSSASEDDKDASFEKCVVAGACTVPMLELYQHSCRELRKYISEGRRIVREIETETFVENPPLFREYMSASPEFKTLMDNQFKNVKSHARLLSKAMWYEWRMRLQEGLSEGLLQISDGMEEDDQILQKKQELLDTVLPAMMKRLEELETEQEDLEAVARELADCDPEELQKARDELVSMDAEIAEKTKKIAELRALFEESEEGIKTLAEQKQQCLEDIKDAEKIREECRGWSSTEISASKARTEELEKKHGWAITGISGTTISMSYKREVELVFDISAFQQAVQKKGQQVSHIDLWYIAANREQKPIPSTPEKEFFLQCIRDHVRSLPQATTPVSSLLKAVSMGWDKANTVAGQVRFLNLTFPTLISKTSDTSINIKSSVLLVPLQTKVEVTVALQSTPSAEGVEVTVTPLARVVYGEQFNATKMTDFLSGKLGGRVLSSEGEKGEGKMSAWGDAVQELHRKLLARGQRAAAAASQQQ
ncbi:kinetochore protein spc7 [Podospora aff. communis PSN243]|uniref:Kinetochore protein spc7 n=1 Tax=Podospora aff. communis PSN243 TaxID=3040156 RepID=A0AAV9H4U6_9PEZI|nr:kinetochore protein spc7 [Podospora aff. communis PSN243]